ncbi:hypothetical protein HNR46_001738 [Haloferula luteola]|uniref:Uncharacterized protein n=1 Tax=Haloferula luteola TaxID=595692 RepID=A0A840VFB9_9BACT|nr:hypothetical protein [Haloferula luteola]
MLKMYKRISYGMTWVARKYTQITGDEWLNLEGGKMQ